MHTHSTTAVCTSVNQCFSVGCDSHTNKHELDCPTLLCSHSLATPSCLHCVADAHVVATLCSWEMRHSPTDCVASDIIEGVIGKIGVLLDTASTLQCLLHLQDTALP